jgi:predicted amidohydrolase
MRITIAQMCVDRDLVQNKHKIISLLQHARRDEWMVFPEGALTGYFPEDADFLSQFRPEMVDEAVQEIGQVVKQMQCHCLLGTALFSDQAWYNAVVLQSYLAEPQVYQKINLSTLDQHHFAAGKEAPVYLIDGVTIGVQVCREVGFPDDWAALKKQGAQVIFHINNALKPYDQAWERLLIERAVDNHVFVCSVNNAAEPQKLTSYLVAPSGVMLLRAQEQTEQLLSCELELDFNEEELEFS